MIIQITANSEWQKCHRNEQNVYTCPQLTAVYQSRTILITLY